MNQPIQNKSPQYQEPYYLQKLKQSGVFTKGDLLELEDHFYCAYEMELESGSTPLQAMQKAEQQIGDSENLIEKYQLKNRNVIWWDMLGFVVFGLIIQNLTLVSITRALCNFSFFLPYLIVGENPSQWLSYLIWLPSMLLILSCPYILVRNRGIVLDFLERKKVWSLMAFGILISPIILESLSFFLIKHTQVWFPSLTDIWSSSSILSMMLKSWSILLLLGNLFWFFVFAILVKKNSKKPSVKKWNMRWVVFFLMGAIGGTCLSLMFHYHLSLFSGLARGLFVYSVLLACLLFPFFYNRFFWKKAYLA